MTDRGALLVAAYCRVSTDRTDQANSLRSQREYFHTYINGHPGWRLAQVYADEGLSGTSIRRRAAFQQMMEDAAEGKFGLILTKEVSRFARNTVDTLAYTRRLKDLGVGVVFLSDSIDTRDNDGELRLTIMASMAQEESRKTSQRVKWGQRRRMEAGEPLPSAQRRLRWSDSFMINIWPRERGPMSLHGSWTRRGLCRQGRSAGRRTPFSVSSATRSTPEICTRKSMSQWTISPTGRWRIGDRRSRSACGTTTRPLWTGRPGRGFSWNWPGGVLHGRVESGIPHATGPRGGCGAVAADRPMFHVPAAGRTVRYIRAGAAGTAAAWGWSTTSPSLPAGSLRWSVWGRTSCTNWKIWREE